MVIATKALSPIRLFPSSFSNLLFIAKKYTNSPAAMRYTEARMRKISEEIMADIEKETVDFQLNFDDTLYEPKVMPTRVPTLLINGATGIAVGMATNMAPHNLTEVIDGTLAYIDNNDIEIDELINHT